MADTHCEAWRSSLPDNPPDGSIWQFDFDVTLVKAVALDGLLLFGGADAGNTWVYSEAVRVRRVYPPGSVLPDPRMIDVSRSTRQCGGNHNFLKWPFWQVQDPKGGWLVFSDPKLNYCTRGMVWELFSTGKVKQGSIYSSSGEFVCYPVQQLENGAFVAVPWSVLETQCSTS